MAADRFDRLHREYGAALRRLAWVYAYDGPDVDDLLQEVWFAVWRALPTFRGDCSERTFIYRIAHNRGLTFRSRRRLPLAGEAAIATIPDGQAGPDELAERASSAAVLLDAVRRLPDPLKQVVVLHLEGLGNQEIAAISGLSENNVAVRLNRARHRLRHDLAPSESVV